MTTDNELPGMWENADFMGGKDSQPATPPVTPVELAAAKALVHERGLCEYGTVCADCDCFPTERDGYALIHARAVIAAVSPLIIEDFLLKRAMPIIKIETTTMQDNLIRMARVQELKDAAKEIECQHVGSCFIVGNDSCNAPEDGAMVRAAMVARANRIKAER